MNKDELEIIKEELEQLKKKFNIVSTFLVRFGLLSIFYATLVVIKTIMEIFL